MGAKKKERERLVKIFTEFIKQHENFELLYSKKLDCYLLLELNFYMKDVEDTGCYYEPKEFCRKIQSELYAENIPFGEVELGIMIETPAAAVISRELAKEVQFFSVGTNDLTQYTLAIDRQNTNLDEFYDAHHPAVLELLRMIAENAHKEGIWAGICGELGADPTLTDTFLQMGYDELSVSPGRVLELRKKICESEG